MKKEGFIVYTSFYDAIETLTQEKKGDLLDAIFKYHIDGSEPEGGDPLVRAIFIMMRAYFKVDKEKWQKTVKARREAGRKGGLARAANAQTNVE